MHEDGPSWEANTTLCHSERPFPCQRPGLPSGLFPSRFPVRTPHAYPFSPTCHMHSPSHAPSSDLYYSPISCPPPLIPTLMFSDRWQLYYWSGLFCGINVTTDLLLQDAARRLFAVGLTGGWPFAFIYKQYKLISRLIFHRNYVHLFLGMIMAFMCRCRTS
jgi:hypothetical protein